MGIRRPSQVLLGAAPMVAQAGQPAFLSSTSAATGTQPYLNLAFGWALTPWQAPLTLEKECFCLKGLML